MSAYTKTSSPGFIFDQIADRYDESFTRTPIGRAQRRAVWRLAGKVFKPGDHVLELNCGTGEDALYLARLGLDVVACDVSERMIAVAQRRKLEEAPELMVTFAVKPIEHIRLLAVLDTFDGVFSNFSGLNCVDDLQHVAEDLASLTKPGANLLICLSSHFCLWEILWYVAHLKFRTAVRRLTGKTEAQIAGNSLRVWYPTVRQVCHTFAQSFTIQSVTAIGLSVPPSYASDWAQRHQRMLRFAERFDAWFSSAPLLRVAGDHVLFHMRRCAR